MTHDPVCQVEVDEDDAASLGMASEVSGQTFYFCSSKCKRQFDANPEDYINPQAWNESESTATDDYLDE